jgi:hypothetical protein
MHRLVAPGLIEIAYTGPEELSVDRQSETLRLVEQQCEQHPTAIYFVVANVGRVDFSVPQFWQKVVQRLAPRLCALAVSSPSLAVRTAAAAFRISIVLTRLPLKVGVFERADEAQQWSREARLSSTAAPAR